MRQPLYIHAATAISAQHSFDPAHFLKPLITTGNGRFYAQDAPFAQYISPVAIRRMSRILKITISAAMECLRQSGIKTPDAIITGTGRGGVTDMEVFVKDMIRLDEGPMNPTNFIQSTYNSPNGWIAMQSGCTCYNQTYVHRGCSFELALLDAQMLMAEATGPQHLLVGCYDEMTEDYFTIRSKRGYWKHPSVVSTELLDNSHSPGTIGGEGASFFVLSNMRPAGGGTSVQAIVIVQDASPERISEAALQMLSSAGIRLADLSLVLTGLNGDYLQSKLYEDILALMPKSLPIAAFKHLSGEYDTATGFALWLINYISHNKSCLGQVLLPGYSKDQQKFSKTLIINHFLQKTASVILVNTELT